jgi:hypothetical protein
MALPKSTGYLSFLEIAQYVESVTSNISLTVLSLDVSAFWDPTFNMAIPPYSTANFYGDLGFRIEPKTLTLTPGEPSKDANLIVPGTRNWTRGTIVTVSGTGGWLSVMPTAGTDGTLISATAISPPAAGAHIERTTFNLTDTSLTITLEVTYSNL